MTFDRIIALAFIDMVCLMFPLNP